MVSDSLQGKEGAVTITNAYFSRTHLAAIQCQEPLGGLCLNFSCQVRDAKNVFPESFQPLLPCRFGVSSFAAGCSIPLHSRLLLRRPPVYDRYR